MNTPTRVGLVGLTALSLALTGCAADTGSGDGTDVAGTDEEFVWEDGVLQPLSDGFPDSPLTLLVIDEPGSADGIYARQLQQALDALSPVRIDVIDRQDFTAFGTWEAMQWVENEPRGNEGYISVISTTPSDVVDFSLVPIERDLGVTLETRNSVISTEVVPYVVVQRADAPWGNTLDDMIEYAQENPGVVRYASRGVGAGLDIAMENYMDTWGIQVEKIIGGPQPESVALVGAGAADITILTPDIALGAWQSERVDVIMIGGNSAPAPWEDVPTAAEFGLGDMPWGANRIISVTEATPESHRNWLFELYSTAAEDEQFKEARTQLPGLTARTLGHDEVMELSRTAQEAAEVVVRRLGLHWEDQ